MFLQHERGDKHTNRKDTCCYGEGERNSDWYNLSTFHFSVVLVVVTRTLRDTLVRKQVQTGLTGFARFGLGRATFARELTVKTKVAR